MYKYGGFSLSSFIIYILNLLKETPNYHIMLRRIVGSNIIKRFNHTHSKTTFPENNKTIENLLREQNNHLDNISHSLQVISHGLQAIWVVVACIQLTITFKR
jgi:hypothetical protein